VNPQLVLLAGPNGAGKSSFYEVHLKHLQAPFLNADNLARDLSVADYEASQILDEMRAFYIERRVGFISETVFSDPVGAKVAMLRAAMAAGFDVRLVYIGLENAALSQARVLHRVANGGHPVPADKIVARFPRSLANLAEAVKFVSVVEIYDNSDRENPHRRLARFEEGVLKWKTTGPVPAWAKPLLG
jgi:predicted ABC-type ATPase